MSHVSAAGRRVFPSLPIFIGITHSNRKITPSVCNRMCPRRTELIKRYRKCIFGAKKGLVVTARNKSDFSVRLLWSYISIDQSSNQIRKPSGVEMFIISKLSYVKTMNMKWSYGPIELEAEQIFAIPCAPLRKNWLDTLLDQSSGTAEETARRFRCCVKKMIFYHQFIQPSGRVFPIRITFADCEPSVELVFVLYSQLLESIE